MENVLTKYTEQDIKDIFSAHWPDFKMTVYNDATAGIDTGNPPTVKVCQRMFEDLGFELVKEKHLLAQQKTKHNFYIFYTRL